MRHALTGLAAAILAPAIALATPPEPRKPVEASFFTGRWYEIARTDNDRQRDCQAPTYVFEPLESETRARFTLTCRKGSPMGEAESLRVTVRIPEDGQRNKFRVTALAGLMGLNYWVLDIADNEDWAILATEGGTDAWLLARRPSMNTNLKTRLISQMGQMGYPRSRIVLPEH